MTDRSLEHEALRISAPSDRGWSRRRFLGTLGKSAVGLGLMGPFPAQVGRSQAPLRLGFIPVYPMMQYFVAREQGWYEEAGIPIEASRFSSGPPIVQALAAGELDLAYIGISPAAVSIARGVPAQVVAANVKEPNVILANERLRSLWEQYGAEAFARFREAEGRRAKIVTLPEGSTPDILLRFWIIERLGLDLEASIEIVPVGAPQVLQSIARGDVDGASVIEPSPTLIAERGFPFEPIAFADEILPGQPGAVVEVTQGLLNDQPERVEALTEIHLEATKFVQDNPDQTAEFASAVIGPQALPVEIAREALDSRATCFISDPHAITDGTLVYNDLQNRLGIVDRQLEVPDVFDFSFYDRMVDERPELDIEDCA
ncbi:MAG: ABC transporter substrate-binding protein [Candidatus Bipolaricaulia bacterium]